MEKKNALREWVYSLPYSEVNQKRDEIITRCKITPYVWLNWLAGRTPVPELAKPVVNDIANKNVFEV